jgi:hypothetical protein
MPDTVMATRGKSMRRFRSERRGSSLIEFVLSSLLWVTLLIGTLVIGGKLIKAIQVIQLCRDVGHMWAYGVDFSQTSNQNLVAKLAQGLNFNTNGTGNGVVILSNVTYIGPNQCTAGGLAANTTACPNMNQTVFTRRVVVGNASIRVSNFGTPNTGIVGANGYIAVADYLTNASARTNNFIALLPLAPGNVSSLTETYFSSPELDWPGVMTGTGEYSYAIF